MVLYLDLILGWICLVKKARYARIFFISDEVHEGGGGDEKNGETKSLMLDLVLVYYLGKTGALMMKLDQVPV